MVMKIDRKIEKEGDGRGSREGEGMGGDVERGRSFEGRGMGGGDLERGRGMGRGRSREESIFLELQIYKREVHAGEIMTSFTTFLQSDHWNDVSKYVTSNEQPRDKNS